MCDFEDFPIISKYPLSQAILDGVLTRLTTYHGKSVVATAHLLQNLSKADLLKVFREFCQWDIYTRPGLPEEDQLFHMEWNGRKVWVIEDEQTYTLMYPEDY